MPGPGRRSRLHSRQINTQNGYDKNRDQSADRPGRSHRVGFSHRRDSPSPLVTFARVPSTKSTTPTLPRTRFAWQAIDLIAASLPQVDLENPITVYYNKRSRIFGTKPFRGVVYVAKKNANRAIYAEPGGPAQLYRFVDVASFTEDWADLKLGDDELRALEDEIARNPTRAPVVPGGGGARKTRRPAPASGKGKSGGYRVLYAFLPLYGIVLLIAAWPKSEREDLERNDYNAIGKIIARIEGLLDRGRIL
jgi:hypothetical protein